MDRTLHFQSTHPQVAAWSQPRAKRTRLGFTATLSCLITLAGCAGSQTNEPPAATAASEPTLRESNRGDSVSSTAVRPHAETSHVAVATPGPQPTSEPNVQHDAPKQLQATEVQTTTPPAPSAAADNTDRNKRDRDDRALTPLDQGNNASDIKLTAAIRKALMDESSLSFDAKNVKIITSAGRVVLRGPVKNTAEKTVIESHAQRAAGAGHVTSQLEIAK